MKKIAASLVAVAVASLVITGCSKPADKPADKPAETTQSAATPPAASAANFSAKSADGKLEARVVVSGKVASIEMATTGWAWNATFASKTPKDAKNKDGEGHAILTLDTKDPMYVGTMRSSLTGLASGKHALKVQLVQNDNTPVTEATVNFEVK